MSTYDHYVEAKKVAELLAEEGHAAVGQSLLQAIAGGTSGTEIFMRLKYHLEQVLNAPDLSAQTGGRVRLLYEKLDEALR